MRIVDISISMTGRRAYETFRIRSSVWGNLLNIEQGKAKIGCSQVDLSYESILQSHGLGFRYAANTPQFACASPQAMRAIIDTAHNMRS